jgi:PAS domain S-box-containing protein
MTVDPQPALVATNINVNCQKLLARIPHLAWLMSAGGEILVANQLWSEYIGRSRADEAQLLDDRRYLQIGINAPNAPKSCNCCWTFGDLLHETERERFVSAWTAASRLLEPLSIKLRLMSAIDEWEWFQVELEPDRDRSGAIVWIGTAMRLGSEAAMPGEQQSPQFLEALLAHASDGIVACDAQGRLVLFNRMAQQFHGLPPEPLPPEEWAKYYDLYDGDGSRPLAKDEIPLFRALQGAAVVGQEMTIAPTNGTARSLLANATAIYSTTGVKLGAVALMRDITEYQQAMTALKLSERKFRAIFDGVFQFIGLTTPDGTLIEVNQTALNFGGIVAEEAIGRRFWEVAGWRFSPAVQQQLAAATERAAQGEFFRCKLELAGADDRPIPIDFSLSPIRNDLGEVTMLIPEGRDLSQIEQAERDRHRIERYTARLATALKVAKAGAWYWELSDNKLDWTPEFEALFDYEPGSTQKTYSEWAQRIHPDDLHRVESIAQATIAGRLPQHRCEYRIVCRDGSIRWVDGIGEIGTDEAGKTYLAGLVRDITEQQAALRERKRDEEALRRSEELFRHTFEYTPVGFAHVAPHGRLLRVNRKFCEIIGYSNAELLQLTFHDLTEPNDLAEDVALVDRLLADEIQEYTLEKRYIHKQGHHVWVSLTVSLVRAAAIAGQLGTPSYFLSAVQDITHRKQLEIVNHHQTAELLQLNRSLLLTQQQLKERNDDLDNFVRIASHDLKAPLRAIANLADWIEDDITDRLTEEDRHQFQLLRQRVNRMNALIDGLLRYSRLGREKLDLELVDVSRLIAETIDSLAPPPEFAIEIVSPLPTIHAKRILLGQVFANLLSNAIKHHHRTNGRIEITAEDLGDRYQFSISDDGPGIPPGEARERIFEIFQTLKPSSSTENTGIGLALVKKIIEGEGGRIWSIDRLQGACFCFTWPK